MSSYEEQRRRMVADQLQARGLNDERVLAAFHRVPRHEFVPPDLREQAYTDHPLPIGASQTISQPYIAALMTAALQLQGHEQVLEIGTGSGYQAAILSELALEVYSVELIPELLDAARLRLAALGYLNVHLSVANGSLGWPAHAPYDAILVTAAAPQVPEPLLAQLADPGRLVLPIGRAEAQTLTLVSKDRGTVRQAPLTSCVFVPLLGRYGWPSEPGAARS